MSPSLKAFLALLFVAGTGAILIQPVLDAGDEPLVTEEREDPQETATNAAAPSPSPEPSPSPVPSPTSDSGGLIAGPFRTQPLFDGYPASCLRPPPPSDRGDLIAAVEGGRVAFGTPAGPTDPGPAGHTTLGKVKALVGFDGSASLYAARSRSDRVVFAPPEGSQGADGDLGLPPMTALVWSPTSDCALAIDDQGGLFVMPSRGPLYLVREAVRSLAISPDGRRLAVVMEEGKTTSVWIADLDGTSMTEVQRERTGPRVTLEGWSPDAKTLYLTLGPDSGLSFISVPRPSAPPLSGGVVATKVRSLEQCDGRLLGIVNGAIAEISTRGPEYITQTQAGYSAVSCSPNGAFMAALRDDNLFLLDGEGRELRDLTLDSGLRDIHVDWGSSGAGLLFGRQPVEGGAAQVWHLAEGGAARNTGLTYSPGPGAIDWSASPPTGLPLR